MGKHFLKHIAGICLAFGVLWFGAIIDNYRYDVLGYLFPQLIEYPSGAYVLILIGAGFLILGDLKDRKDQRVTASRKSSTPTCPEPSMPTRPARPNLHKERAVQQGVRPTSEKPAHQSVWCSQMFNNIELIVGYAGPQDTPEARKKQGGLSARLERGMPVAASEFPKRIRAMDTPAPQLKPLSLISGRLPMVSEDLAACLAQLDLGDGSFVPTMFADESGKVLPHRHLFWNIASEKKVFLPHECIGLMKHRPRHGRKVREQWYPPDRAQDDIYAVAKDALVGADIWVDFVFPSVVFFSDRCKQHLSAAGYGDLFKWYSVRVI